MATGHHPARHPTLHTTMDRKKLPERRPLYNRLLVGGTFANSM
jgi:hypothetical protein